MNIIFSECTYTKSVRKIVGLDVSLLRNNDEEGPFLSAPVTIRLRAFPACRSIFRWLPVNVPRHVPKPTVYPNIVTQWNLSSNSVVSWVKPIKRSKVLMMMMMPRGDQVFTNATSFFVREESKSMTINNQYVQKL